MTTLEKIRAEIENTIDQEKLAFDGQFDKGLNMALLIIDKYTKQEPKIGYCRDCKWWKDKDGVYRRGSSLGVAAESQCPINRKVVYEGNGYCYMFEPQQESEDKNDKI